MRWAGHIARMETLEPVEGKRRFKGLLLGLENGAIRMKLEDDKETLVPLSIVSRAKLELTDALLDEHRRTQEGAEQTH
jgi:ribosome maturation factor RimP